MMNCGEIRDTLLLLPAGEPAGEGVREHLKGCADCARTAELARAAWDLAAPDRDEPVPAAADRGVRGRIECSRRRPVLLLRIGTAAAVLLMAALWVGRERPKEEPVRLCDGPVSGYLEPAFGTLEVKEGPEPGPLGLRSHSVSVTLDDWVMRTEVEEIFVNTSGQRLEGTFVFPLPPDASLSRFAMEVEGTLVEGELVERVRAREVYEGIVRQMKDPALLEWMPGNVFKARVFPIEPYSEKRVILAYTQAPRMWNGEIRYVYPLVSEKTQAHPPEEIAIRASWSLGKPVRRVDCPTHRADVERRDGRSGRASLVLRGVRPRQDFLLRLETEPDELAVAGHRPEGEEGYVGVAFAPRIAAAPRRAGTTVFVVDRSARMSEQELEVARRVVDRMIPRLPAGERIGLVAHHVDCEVRAPEPDAPESRRAWRDFLWGLKSEGASDVLGAIGRAAALGADTIVYVGKGVPTWGETDASKLDLGGRAFRAVLVGSGTGEGTLAALGGELRRIAAGGDTGAEIEAAARTAGLEPLRGLEVEIGAERRALPPLYPGERVFVFARYAAPGRTRVAVGGRAVEVEHPAGPTAQRPLMRLWAQGALEERVAECRRAGEPREAVDAIVAMSRKYQVMTPYTSFLVLESEKAYEQYRIERMKRLDEGESDGKSARKAAERAEIEAVERFRAGERMLAEGRYREAVQAFEAAERGASKELLPKVRESLGEARLAAKFVQPQTASEWEFLLSRLKAAYEVGEQAKASQADERYRLAERYYHAGDLEKAALECEKALALHPRHAAATALRLEVDFILGRGAPTPATQEYSKFFQSALVRHQQTLVEVDNALERGRRMEASGDRAAAEREYRKVLEYAKWMPTGVELETRRKDAQALLHGRTADEQERIRASQRQYEEALRHHHEGRFEEAKLASQRAVASWTGNVAARKLLADVSQIFVGGRAEFGTRELADHARSDFRVRIEEAQIEITKHVRDGERYLQARMYEEAQREFKAAEHKIGAIPYDVKAMNDLLPRVRDSFVKAENARILDEMRAKEEKRPVFEAEASAGDAATRREVTRRMAHLLELSYMALDQRRYDRAIKLADEILLIDPHYAVAKELKEDAEKTRHKEEYYDVLGRKVERWKQLTDDEEEAVIPFSQTVRFPSRDEWAIISRRLTEAVLRTGGGPAGDEDPDLLAIERKLATMKIDLAFENSKLEDILAFIRDFSGLNILLDAAVRDHVDPEKPMTFKAKDLVVRDALKLLLAQRGLDYRVTDDRVVLLTDPERAGDGVPASAEEARRSLEEARRTFNLGDYDRAERRLRKVLESGSSPGPERREAAELLERTRQARVEKRREEERSLARLLADDKARDDFMRRVNQKRELELLFGQAQLYFGQEQFPRCVEVCEKILKINPNLVSVAEMRNVAQRLNHMRRGRDNLTNYLEEWKRTFGEIELNGTPDRGDELAFPGAERWGERSVRPPAIRDEDVQIATAAVDLSRRRPKGIAQLEEDVVPEDKEILDKLRSIRITIDMQNAPLTAVVDYLREVSGLNIHLQGIENPDQEIVTLKVGDVLLDGALRLLLGPRGKGYEVKDGVVVITTAEALRGRVRLELYDVQDLTYGMQDFPGVDVTLARAPSRPATLRPRAEPPGRRVPAKELLSTFRVDLEVRAGALETIQLLADRSGLAFSIDDDARAKLDRAPAAEREFRGVVLDEVLRRLLDPVGLSHFVASDGAVVVQVQLWTGEDLAARVKAAVFPDSWVEADGRTIQFQNGLLIVRHTAEAHAAVRRFLAALRQR